MEEIFTEEFYQKALAAHEAEKQMIRGKKKG